MLESSGCLFSPRRHFSVRFGLCAALGLIAACASESPRVEPVDLQPQSVVAAPLKAPADPAAQNEEARATLAQAETDVQRARSKRVLWTKAWDALLEARKANEQRDPARAIQQARRASEFAQLGVEQAGYPTVR
jgi:hypothetical protein